MARKYDSAVRERQAAETRQRILAAAREEFAASGFDAATVAAIARRAEVSAPTIYATYGSKAALLTALLDVIEQDADIGPAMQRIRATEDPAEQLRLFIHWADGFYSGGGDVIEAAIGATSRDEVRAMWDEGSVRRRQGCERFVERFVEADVLRDDLPPDAARDRMWALTSPNLHRLLRVECGWTADQYVDWVTTLLVRELLGEGRA